MANAEVLAKAPKSGKLGAALGTDMPTTPGVSVDFSKPMTGQNYLSNLEKVGTAQAEATTGLEMAKYNLEAAKDREKANNAEREALDLHTQAQEMNKRLAENPVPTFKPTQDDAMALGQLFSLVSTMGVMLGGSGKMSSMNALGAMSGMLEGFQKGRTDLFRREKETFDKEMAKMKAVREDIEKNYNEYKELLAKDREAADQKAMAIISQTGASSLAAESFKKGRADVVGEIVKASRNMQEKMEERAFDLTKMQKQFENQLELKKQEAALKQGVALPKEKELGQYRARFETIKNIDEIESLLKDPEFRRIVNPTTAITPALLQNLRDEYPQLANKLARVQAIEFQTGGKALTASEQKILEPIYGWRGKTAEALESQLGETKRSLELTQGLYEKDYPGLVARKPMYEQAYGQLGTLSTLPMEQAEQTTYKVGDIVSKGGKQYKVTGVYQDDPSNPEVEEIK